MVAPHQNPTPAEPANQNGEKSGLIGINEVEMKVARADEPPRRNSLSKV
jgi:hypothetical protein